MRVSAKPVLLAAVLAGLLAAQKPAPRFARDLYPLLQKAGCPECHNPDGVASVTRLHFPEADAGSPRIEAFGRSLAMLVDRAKPEESLLLQKPTLRIPHTGGKRIVPGSPEEAALRSWIGVLARLAPAPAVRAATTTASPAEQTLLRRLTHSQFDNAVRDLLGDVSRPARQFPSEDYVNGFKNQYQAQSVSPILAEAYGTAAEKLARSVRPPECSADCADRFVTGFGRKAFRRPLTAEERRRYAGLYGRLGAPGVVEAMLQSPGFLFWTASTSVAEWKRYARASRLSFFLWNTTPDEPLLDRAARGDLDAPEGVEREVRRMLDDPRAREALDEFVSEWLRFDTVAAMVKERRSFPQFNREVALAMAEESRAFVADLVWSGRNFMEFFNGGHTFVNADLASIYGLEAPESEFGRVAYPADSERSGILGQGTFLAVTSKPAETSPTARGLFVREQFLCQKVPQPPPGTNTNLAPASAENPLTTRQRLGAHVTNEACASCHNLIDPIGYGFEKFNAVGARQEKIRITIPTYNRREPPKTLELDVDSRGWIAGIPNSDFSTPKELGRILATTPQCQQCVVKQVFRYAMGRSETAADRPVLERVFAEFRDSQFRFKQLMIAVVRWTEFPPAD